MKNGKRRKGYSSPACLRKRKKNVKFQILSQATQNKCGISLHFKLIVGDKSSTEQKIFTLT